MHIAQSPQSLRVCLSSRIQERLSVSVSRRECRGPPDKANLLLSPEGIHARCSYPTNRPHSPVPGATSDRGVQCTGQCIKEYPIRYPVVIPGQGSSRKESVFFKPVIASQMP